jgi:hypothetical protein
MGIWGPGSSYRDHLRAQAEANELSREATDGLTREEDPAEERAESMTNAAQKVVAVVLIVALATGGAWALFGTAPALVTLVGAGLVTIAFVARGRSRKVEADR